MIEHVYRDCHASLALAVRTAEGVAAVLKVAFPDEESKHEADALRHWAGYGAVHLLNSDEACSVLLIERCEPGDYLSSISQERALSVLCELLPRLWVPPFHGLQNMRDVARAWYGSLPRTWERLGRPFERRLLDQTLRAISLLETTVTDPVLANQDLHANNILRARREPWLVIDPKPVVADREFTLAPIIRSSELGHSQTAVRRRLNRLSRALELDEERARLWTMVHTLAWSFEGDSVLRNHLDVVRWLL